MNEEQTTGGTGIDVIIQAARAGTGCALDAERTAQVEATYEKLLARIRDLETADDPADDDTYGDDTVAHSLRGAR